MREPSLAATAKEPPSHCPLRTRNICTGMLEEACLPVSSCSSSRAVSLALSFLFFPGGWHAGKFTARFHFTRSRNTHAAENAAAAAAAANPPRFYDVCRPNSARTPYWRVDVRTPGSCMPQLSLSARVLPITSRSAAAGMTRGRL